MEKEYLGLILFYAVFGTIIVLSNVFYQPSFRTALDHHIYIENVVFTGLSGDSSNSLVLYVKNTGTQRDIVLDQVNISCSDWERMFSVAPDESGLPMGASGRVVLFNVGWVRDVEYYIDVYTSDGQLVGVIRATA